MGKIRTLLLLFLLACARPAPAAVPDLTFKTWPAQARLSVKTPHGDTIDVGVSGQPCPLEAMQQVARAYAMATTVPVDIAHAGYDVVTAQVPQQFFKLGDHAWPQLDLNAVSDQQWQALDRWCTQQNYVQEGALAALLLRAHMSPDMIASLRSQEAGGNDPDVRRWLSRWQQMRLRTVPSFFYVAEPRAVATRDAALDSIFNVAAPLDDFSRNRLLALTSELGAPVTAYNRTTGRLTTSKRRLTLSSEQRAAMERWLAIRGRGPGALFCALTAKGPEPGRNMTLAAVDEALWRQPADNGDIAVVMRDGQPWLVRPLNADDVLRFARRRLEEAASDLPLPPRHVVVAFHSHPSGATVYERGQVLGSTDAPVTLDMTTMLAENEPRYLDAVLFHFRLQHFRDTDVALNPALLERGEPVSVEMQGPWWAFLLAWSGRRPWLWWVLLALAALALLCRLLLADRPAPVLGGGYEWDALVGTTVGTYSLSSRVGDGTSAIFRGLPSGADARDAVAIKLLRVEALDDTQRQALNEEIEHWSDLNHPHMVGLLDWGESEPYAFLVMEWVSGSSLRSLLRQSGGHPMMLGHAFNLLRPIFAAVEAAHQAGLVHRNLKPENIMVGAGERVKVLEFGTATQQVTRLTRSGEIVGSFAYRAPERLEGATADARADQYALGVITYELLAGVAPFSDGISSVLMRDSFERRPQPLATLRTDLPGELCEAVMRMLAAAPGERFDSVAEAWRALERAALRGVEPER